MLVLLFPGQGSQSPGLLQPWLDLPGARQRVAAWSELTGLDLLGSGQGEPRRQQAGGLGTLSGREEDKHLNSLPKPEPAQCVRGARSRRPTLVRF